MNIQEYIEQWSSADKCYFPTCTNPTTLAANYYHPMKFRFILLLTLLFDFTFTQCNSGTKSNDVAYHKNPEFPGGSDSLQSFLKNNLRWPASDWDGQGIVKVELMIDQNGRIGKTTILNSLGEDCDNEILRLVNTMPTWKLALNMKSQKVSATVTVPIVFRLESE